MTDNSSKPQSLPRGALSITEAVIVNMIGYAAMESYGVVGMAAPSLQDGIAKLLPKRALGRGVTIAKDVDGIDVSLYVIIEQGMNIATVSKNLADRVRFVLESYADLKVREVSVHVQGIHTSAKSMPHADSGATQQRESRSR
jgi:uncharacterized alkaline shock family protein YloU